MSVCVYVHNKPAAVQVCLWVCVWALVCGFTGAWVYRGVRVLVYECMNVCV